MRINVSLNLLAKITEDSMKRIAIIALILTLFIFLLPLMAVREKPIAGDSEIIDEQPENAIEAAGSAVVVKNKAGKSGDSTGTQSGGKNSGTEIIEKNDQQTFYPDDADIQVRVKDSDRVLTMDLHSYLLGVVSAEMPAAFPAEALKAQAVAARTFTYSRMKAAKEGKPSHNDADVCTSASHCKAYMPWEEIKSKWEELGRDDYVEKVEKAVRETNGEVIVYNEEPIIAVFHAASGKYTENAKDVWGSEVPYLKSVESPDGEEYTKKVTFSADEFQSLFIAKNPDAVFGDQPSEWIGEIVKSEAGGVIRITIGGVQVSGSVVRSIFNLASANFDIKADRDKVMFSSRGYGHCVGMSQYGARALALKGKDYREILSWYYTGIEIKKIGMHEK